MLKEITETEEQAQDEVKEKEELDDSEEELSILEEECVEDESEEKLEGEIAETESRVASTWNSWREIKSRKGNWGD